MKVKQIVKRAFDLILSAILVALLSPILLLIALLIRAKMGAPVIFRQVRPGYLGKPFVIYKFRTMVDERGSPDESRLTSLGRWLRQYSLDELPQLFNVLKGELSLVGPRPLLMEYLPLYSEEQARRHEVKPGITGWAQVNGRNAIDWEEKFALDVWYVEHHSLRLDLKILWMTVSKVFKSEGISMDGYTTMPLFRGNCNRRETEVKDASFRTEGSGAR